MMAIQSQDTASEGLSRRRFLGARAKRAAPVALGTGCLTFAGVACRLCDDACEVGAIRFLPQTGGHYHPKLNSETCTGCLACAEICPAGAINLAGETSHA